MSKDKDTLSKELLLFAKKENSNYTEPDVSNDESQLKIDAANADYHSRISLRKNLVKWILIFGGIGFLVMSGVIVDLIYECSKNGIDAEESSRFLSFLKWYLTGTLIEIFASIAFTVKQVFSMPKIK